MESIFESPRDEEDILDVRLSCCLIFHVTLAELREIKQKLRGHLDRLVY